MAEIDYVMKYGNQLGIHLSDGSIVMAYPTDLATQWIAGAGGNVGPGGDFAWPFEQNTITSEYGPRGAGRFHEGIDFGTGGITEGTPIPSVGNGSGSQNYYHAAFGNLLIIDHGVMDAGTYATKQVRSLYAHMVAPSPIAVGAPVTTGQIIGNVGNTGSASQGNHLHLEIHVTNPGDPIVWNTSDNGGFRTAVNPRTFLDEYSQ